MVKYFHYLFFAFVFFSSCKNVENSDNCSIIFSSDVIGIEDGYSEIKLTRIRYLSDSYKVAGFIVKPKNIKSGKKLPLIIYNRGGNRDFGAITGNHTRYLKYLSSLGYVVMATQYRGNSFSEGNDEFGGDDLNDIKCLIEIAKTKDYIDSDNIGVLGYSRGGLMAYLLSKDTDDIKTLITVGAPTDMFLSSKNRPQLYNKVFYELIGDTISKKEDFISRSPIYWADKINEPALVIHGTEDKRVSVNHTLKLMDSIKNTDNNITPLFIEGGNHSVSNYRKLRNDTIANWFNYYLKSL